jgi:tetratricopeptide (TPR) repeat protein
MFTQKHAVRKSVLLILPFVAWMAASCNNPSTILFEPSPTVPVFKPGDPTATPQGTDITNPDFIQGVAAYNEKRFEDAIRFMSLVIEVEPKLAPPYRYRAMAYWYLGDCESGLPDLETALSIDPKYATAWADHGVVAGCLGDKDQELRDYEKAISLDPSLSKVHHNLGVYYYEMGDYERSLEEYSLSAAIDPTRASAWNGRSEALTKLERFFECIESANKALEVDQTLYSAFASRGYCQLQLGNNRGAMDDFNTYIAHDSSDSLAWANLAIAQHGAGYNLEAIYSNDQALKLDPDLYIALINRGNVYVDLGEYNKALDDFDAALKFGDIPAAYSGRGDAYYGLEEYEQAVADHEFVVSTYPSAHAYCMLSLSYFELGRYEDSLQAAETSIEIDPNCGGEKLLEIQARSYHHLGQHEQALDYINRALDIRQYPMGSYYRGIIFQALGRNEEAIQDFERFLILTQPSEADKAEVIDAKTRLEQLKP